MSSSLSQDVFLDQVLRLRDHGRYREAVELLRSDNGHDLLPSDIYALELGESLQSQGLWGEALQTWENYLGASPSTRKATLVDFRIRMATHLLYPMVHENLDGLAMSFSEAQKTYKDFVSMSSESKEAAHSIYIKISYCKILRFVSQFHLPQVIPEAFEWMNDAFQSYLAKRDYRLALAIASQYAAVATAPFSGELSGLEISDWQDIAQSLVETAAMPVVLKARAMDLVAEHEETISTLTQRYTYEQEAARLYIESSHAYGASEIHIRQLSRKCAAGEGDLEKNIAQIFQYIEEFEQQDYHFGVHRALQILQASLPDTRYFTYHLSLIQLASQVVEKSGAKLLYMMVRFKSIAIWLLHSGRAARVVEAALPLFEDIRNTDGCKFKASVANVISQAYLQLQDFENALHWSDLNSNLLSASSALDCADAATLELRIQVAKALSNLKELDLEELLQAWNNVIEREKQYKILGPAIEKLEALTMLLTRVEDRRVDEYSKRLERLIYLSIELSNKEGEMKLAAFYQSSAALRIAQVSPAGMDSKVHESAVALLEKAVSLYIKHDALVQAANTRQLQALAHLGVFQSTRDFGQLERAFDLTSIALDCFIQLDLTGMVFTAAYWCAYYAFLAWKAGRSTAEFSLDQLSAAEKASSEERVELSIFGGIDALNRKQKMRADDKTQKVYEMAMRVCSQANLWESLWAWIQKSKARSLSDLLALGALMPARLRKDIDGNPITRELHDKEKQLREKIGQSASADRINLRSELHILETQMEEHVSLRELMALRAGTSIIHQQLDDLVTQLEQGPNQMNVVFVDWIIVDGQIFVVAIRNHEPVQVTLCNVSEPALKAWKAEYLKDQAYEGAYNSELEEDDPDYCLRKLDGLILPIAEFSEEEDLLVLCATGPLHSIPLHALFIDEEPLILRNPVVYCTSLTSSWQCWQAVRGSCSKPLLTLERMKIMAVYNDDADTDFSFGEQRKIHESVEMLAAKMGADAVIGNAADNSSFTQMIAQTSLFHFHGHSVLSSNVLTEQSILLYNGTFSISDVFNLKLGLATHITLIACDSATQSISAKGDEPLGLVTAFLCAGASSVLGTIWPIRSATGREFSAHFYDELAEAHASAFPMDVASGGRGLVNVANALRNAVIEIRGQVRTRKPYHWASFVLHGSPFIDFRVEGNRKS